MTLGPPLVLLALYAGVGCPRAAEGRPARMVVQRLRPIAGDRRRLARRGPGGKAAEVPDSQSPLVLPQTSPRQPRLRANNEAAVKEAGAVIDEEATFA